MIEFYNSWIATPMFLLELLLLEAIFSVTLVKRPYWFIRFFGLALGGLVISFWMEVCYQLITGNPFGYGEQSEFLEMSIAKFIFFIVIYLMSIGILWFSYREPVANLILVSCGAYAMQHIVYNVYLLLDLVPIEGELNGFIYMLGVQYGLMLFGCLFVYFLVRHRGGSQSLYRGNRRRKIILSFVVIVTCILLSRLANDDPERGRLAYLAESLYAITACTLILFFQFSLQESDLVHAQVDTYKELLHQEREQYKLSKKNIELINIKCHDLKHQIAALRQNASEESISEIEKAVMIYDTSIKTGNDVLDVLLREKALQCEAEHITLTCMVQGELVAFMDTMDIYSLFGNLLSNAIESVRKLEEPDNRIITLNARKIGNMVSLHEENYLVAPLTMVDGLPETTKKNKDYHGFGMRSMQRTTEKYHGEMKVSAKNGKFSIDFIFPLEQQ
jgi:hypothetical protein